MPGGVEKVGWDDLSKDERNFFRNPCDYANTTGAAFLAGAKQRFGYAGRAGAVIDRLTEEGKEKALSELDKAVGLLSERGRGCPVSDVEEIRAHLGSETDATHSAIAEQAGL